MQCHPSQNSIKGIFVFVFYILHHLLFLSLALSFRVPITPFGGGGNGKYICVSLEIDTPHHKTNPGLLGLHHLAFNSETREEIDKFYIKAG